MGSGKCTRRSGLACFMPRRSRHRHADQLGFEGDARWPIDDAFRDETQGHEDSEDRAIA